MTAPALTPDQQRDSLRWAAHAWDEQPDDLKTAYREAARSISAALISPTYRLVLRLPNYFCHDDLVTGIPKDWMWLRAGSVVSYLRKRTCHDAIISKLNALTLHPHPIAARIARLAAYLASEWIVQEYVPDIAEIVGAYQLFTPQGELTTSEAQAAAAVEQLANYVHALRNVERLYPDWAGSDEYNDLYAAVFNQLVVQGRALANYFTAQMIADLKRRWQNREVLRGLTLFVPYLDERDSHMRKYQVEVIPTGRIPFRPEFIVGACRLAEQDVRKNPRLSQATRWQLISQLDTITQAFE